LAGDEPLQPLIQSLDLQHGLEDGERVLLFPFLASFDYKKATDSAADAEVLIKRDKFEARSCHNEYLKAVMDTLRLKNDAPPP
jgi:hypothetical protein